MNDKADNEKPYIPPYDKIKKKLGEVFVLKGPLGSLNISPQGQQLIELCNPESIGGLGDSLRQLWERGCIHASRLYDDGRRTGGQSRLIIPIDEAEHHRNIENLYHLATGLSLIPPEGQLSGNKILSTSVEDLFKEVKAIVEPGIQQRLAAHKERTNRWAAKAAAAAAEAEAQSGEKTR